MNSISLVIITHNEEKNIGRCLESVKGIVDEIIVVDSFSNDNTENICNDFGVNFINRKWEGYSNSKNHGNSLAKGKYILSLDADEVLSSELRDFIIKEKTDFKFDGYIFNRKTNYCGKWINHCGWYPDPKLRLWKNESIMWEGDVHENLILPNGFNTSSIKRDILHYSISTISDHINQINKFSDIYAQSAFNRGKKTNLFMMFFKPIERFLITYFFKLGFLDGLYGFVISQLTAHSIFLRHIKLYQLQNQKSNNND